MPRRLGDDPLARAKSARSAQPPEAPIGDVPVEATVPTGRPSNDVFFQRRIEAYSLPARFLDREGTEISEISQLPEIHDAPRPAAASAEAKPEPDAPVSSLQEVVSDVNAPSQVAAPPESAIAEGAASAAPSQEGSVGLLKRLFDKIA